MDKCSVNLLASAAVALIISPSFKIKFLVSTSASAKALAVPVVIKENTFALESVIVIVRVVALFEVSEYLKLLRKAVFSDGTV
jgi:hypothetical protein